MCSRRTFVSNARSYEKDPIAGSYLSRGQYREQKGHCAAFCSRVSGLADFARRPVIKNEGRPARDDGAKATESSPCQSRHNDEPTQRRCRLPSAFARATLHISHITSLAAAFVRLYGSISTRFVRIFSQHERENFEHISCRLYFPAKFPPLQIYLN